MPAAKLIAVRPNDRDNAAGHIFATMRANAFHNRQRAAVADRKAFLRLCIDKTSPPGGAISPTLPQMTFSCGVKATSGGGIKITRPPDMLLQR
jgi:hypothetical protein